ncbi:Sugar transferase involved in LPS biosynthesis (colanic, teichoic acid) [Bacteroides faecichinchillae]|uniref:Sugar transferase involved in LPS biosynthesis (Colanic, teichoic acid) n=1 Tax=Bacteroides faecichinchillae TaxID=871325 RepID=A0A1M5DRN0_9BACE|nr:sugar transferase [Bacteroides faecichinchillae]THG64022.1 sugar transferase [Bacteroides faecichinchillae]SHF69585.1 Sugar transferase involved in LPS biosynthesis (colanic, teichoic acid) [Bacteroides faecichinchillae]
MGKFLIRCYEILFAVLFITVFLWVYMITWITIHIVSPGPAIYKARRVGLHGKIFTCYKFRSMRVDSGKVRLTTLLNDDRVFPFGKFIRATKIDEMPQAFNILFGDMSIVGPRPEDEANAANYYVGEYKHILDVKPGLTSPASLYDYTHGEKYEDSDLYEKEFIPQKLKLELYYVDHKSFFYDNYLILKTSWLILLTILGKKNFEVPKELEAKNIT